MSEIPTSLAQLPPQQIPPQQFHNPSLPLPTQHQTINFDPKQPVETQSCLQTADLRQYLDSHGQNNMSIIIRHAKVVQKSYGTEKRFFCPPPIVKLIGEGWKRKDKNNSRTNENLNEFHAWIRIGAPQDRQLAGDGFETNMLNGNATENGHSSQNPQNPAQNSLQNPNFSTPHPPSFPFNHPTPQSHGFPPFGHHPTHFPLPYPPGNPHHHPHHLNPHHQTLANNNTASAPFEPQQLHSGEFQFQTVS